MEDLKTFVIISVLLILMASIFYLSLLQIMLKNNYWKTKLLGFEENK